MASEASIEDTNTSTTLIIDRQNCKLGVITPDVRHVIVKHGVEELSQEMFQHSHSHVSTDAAGMMSPNKNIINNNINNRNAPLSSSHCYQLESIVIPDSVTVILKEAFSHSCPHLQMVVFISPQTSQLITIGESAFSGCKALQGFIIPTRVQFIHQCAFYCCTSLVSIRIPALVKTIGAYAFAKCIGLNKVIFDPQIRLKEISSCCFLNCGNLVCIQIPSSVQKIHQCAFQNCGDLRSVLFTSKSMNLKLICQGAFGSCHNLQYINIPNSVRTIEPRSFYSCCSLRVFSLPRTLQQGTKQIFQACLYLDQIWQAQQQEVQFEYFGGERRSSVQAAMHLLSLGIINIRSWREIFGDRFKQLPHHQQFYNEVNNNESKLYLDSIPANFDSSLLQTDRHMGMTPLHILCANPTSTSGMIKTCFDKNPEAASIQSNFDLTPLQMYFHRQIMNWPRNVDFHNIYQWNIHDYINLGLDYDGVDVALHFHGHTLQQQLEIVNEESTGMFPFMAVAASNTCGLVDVYRMALESIPYLRKNEIMTLGKRKRIV